jgi:hypothetical protein
VLWSFRGDPRDRGTGKPDQDSALTHGKELLTPPPKKDFLVGE